MAIKGLPEKHKSKQSFGFRGREPWAVTEAGLYRLVMRTNKPEAGDSAPWGIQGVVPASSGHSVSHPLKHCRERCLSAAWLACPRSGQREPAFFTAVAVPSYASPTDKDPLDAHTGFAFPPRALSAEKPETHEEVGT